MPKRDNKKILPLFFVIAALMQFSSAKPMLQKLLCCFGKDPFEQPPTETNITKLPFDCLHEIFQFSAKGDDIKPFLMLRLVCKEFRGAVKSYPWPLSFWFNCKDRKKTLSLGEVFNNVEFLNLRNCNFESSKVVWPTNLRDLRLINCKNFNSKTLKTNLENLQNLQNLEVNNCSQFTGVELEYLKNLHTLKVDNCDGFTGAKLEYLENLQNLAVDACNEFEGTGLEKLTNLQELEVMYCPKFNWAALENLTNLQKLEVMCCPKFNENSTIIKKLKKNGCKVIVH